MPRIEAGVLVNAPVDQVFALARDVERYPGFMPDVKSVRIVERDGGRTVSEWVALVKKYHIDVKWTEEDFWDEAERTCTFRQVKGDYKQYEGIWTFTPAGEGTEMRLQMDYVYDVPLIGPIIKALVNRLMQENSDAMLAALKSEAEKNA
jgi:ribosome-associated toxin RatA of RatAB toxin-antitoxin module